MDVLGLLGTFWLEIHIRLSAVFHELDVFVLNCQISCTDIWLRFHANYHFFFIDSILYLMFQLFWVSSGDVSVFVRGHKLGGTRTLSLQHHL